MTGQRSKFISLEVVILQQILDIPPILYTPHSPTIYNTLPEISDSLIRHSPS
jgi:hypothetical protein